MCSLSSLFPVQDFLFLAPRSLLDAVLPLHPRRGSKRRDKEAEKLRSPTKHLLVSRWALFHCQQGWREGDLFQFHA
jgi:hypothetical protein